MTELELLREAVRRMRLTARYAPWYGTLADWIDSHGRDLASANGERTQCDSPADVQCALTVARAYLEVEP